MIAIFLPKLIMQNESLELGSKELNHLAAILHVYAGGFDFYKVKKKSFFKKKMEIPLHLKSLQKEQIAQIPQYDP